MSFLRSVTDFFRSSNSPQTRVDKYNLLSPIIATSEYVAVTKKLINSVSNESFTNVLTGRNHSVNPHELKAQAAYKEFVKSLTGSIRSKEITHPLSVISMALDNISSNLEKIEDALVSLFGDMIGDENTEADIKTSTLVILGYIEMSNEFMNWLGHLVTHVSPSGEDIPPYWTKTLVGDAGKMGDYVNNNILKWNAATGGIFTAVRQLQDKGANVTIKTGDMWMDEFIHDNQFSDSQQALMSASLRSPTMWLSDRRVVSYQKKVALYTSRKEWLVSKVALTEARMSGVDPDSLEYKRLKKTSDFYAAQVTKHEQELERLR